MRKKIIAFCLPFCLFANSLESTKSQEIAENQSAYALENKRAKVALIIPKQKIGRYSITTIGTIVSYLIFRKEEFEFQVFDCGDEDEASIQATYQKIVDKDFHFVIAIFTTIGAQISTNLRLETPFYIPTVHYTQLKFELPPSQLLMFGGINYRDQIDKLLEFQKGKRLVAYNDDSPVGERLALILKEKYPQVQEQNVTIEMASTFSRNKKNQEKFVDRADVFFNIPTIKTGLLLSQIGYFRKKPLRFFSTQINYNLSLKTLVQQRDRKNLYIANSIGKIDENFTEYASLLDSDLRYDWVNYSTAIGMEVYYRMIYPEISPYFSEEISNNQVNYETMIYQIGPKGFFPIKTSNK